MKTGRNILISAILALSASGGVAASVAVPAFAGGSAVVASGTGSAPSSYYHT